MWEDDGVVDWNKQEAFHRGFLHISDLREVSLSLAGADLDSLRWGGARLEPEPALARVGPLPEALATNDERLYR